MALDQSALLEVLDALPVAEVDDRIRQAAQTIYQALIEAELTAVIGAAPHQRTEARVAQRNGHRPRLLATTAGDLELRIPKLRAEGGRLDQGGQYSATRRRTSSCSILPGCRLEAGIYRPVRWYWALA